MPGWSFQARVFLGMGRCVRRTAPHTCRQVAGNPFLVSLTQKKTNIDAKAHKYFIFKSIWKEKSISVIIQTCFISYIHVPGNINHEHFPFLIYQFKTL